MKFKSFAVALSLLAALSSVHAAPADPASVDELLRVTKSDTMVDNMFKGMEPMFNKTIGDMAKNNPKWDQLNPAQKRALDALPGKLMAAVRQEMTWERFRPMIVQVYLETFDQEEIEGLIAFYKSPVGQSFVNKMPIAMQKSFAITQEQMKGMMPRLKAALEASMRELEEAK